MARLGARVGPFGGLERKGVDSSPLLSQEGVCRQRGQARRPSSSSSASPGLSSGADPRVHQRGCWQQKGPRDGLPPPKGRTSSSLCYHSPHLSSGRHGAAPCLSFPKLTILQPAQLPAAKTGCHCGVWEQSPAGCTGGAGSLWDSVG